MEEGSLALARAPVLGESRNGNRRYDPVAKAALIERCLQPGVLIGEMAAKYGINPSLLGKWIAKHRSAKAVPFEEKVPAGFVSLDLGAIQTSFRNRSA